MSDKAASSRTKRQQREKALAAKMLRQLREGKDARPRKIRRIGAAIRAGRYENALKWDVALDRVIDEMRFR